MDEENPTENQPSEDPTPPDPQSSESPPTHWYERVFSYRDKSFSLILAFVIFFLGTTAVVAFGYYQRVSQPPEEPAKSEPRPRPAETPRFLESENVSVVAFLKRSADSDQLEESVKFFDVNKQEFLETPAPLTSQNQISFETGLWSPGGRYLPIIKTDNPGEEGSVSTFYFYNAKTNTAKKIDEASGPQQATPSWNSTLTGSQWLDEKTLLIRTGFDGAPISYDWYSVNGESGSSTFPTIYEYETGSLGDLVFKVDGEVPKETSIFLDERPWNYSLPGTVLGVQGNYLISHETGEGVQGTPQPGIFKTSLSTGMSENIRVLNGDWSTQSAEYLADQGLLILHQTNSRISPTKDRFVLLPKADPARAEVLVERDFVELFGTTEIVFDIAAERRSLTGSTFAVTPDGGWILSVLGPPEVLPGDNRISLINIESGEEKVICEKDCLELSTVSPRSYERLAEEPDFITAFEESKPAVPEGWTSYENSALSYSLAYPPGYQRIICPDSNGLFLEVKEEGEKDVINMPTCARDSRYWLEAEEVEQVPGYESTTTYYSVSQDTVDVNGLQATRYIYTRKDQTPAPIPDWYSETYIPLNGSYLRVHFEVKNQLKEFTEILSTFSTL